MASRMMPQNKVIWAILAVFAASGPFSVSAQDSISISDQGVVGSGEASAAENSGPRIKFLDDLFYLGRNGSSHDPYEERIETERHDFTQSTKTVGRHVAQIEGGYTYFYSDLEEEVEHSHTTPEMLLRFGLTDDIEVRARWTYAWSFVQEVENIDGAEDLRFSVKLRTTDQDGLIPESATELRFTAPTGGDAFSTKRDEFGMDYIYGWHISERSEIYGSTGFGTQALGDFGLVPEEPAADRFTAWHQSAAVGTELTERMSMYNELYGIFSYGLEKNYAEAYYNIGVDYYLTDNLVADIRAGVGLTPDSDDFFGGVGGGYRF